MPEQMPRTNILRPYEGLLEDDAPGRAEYRLDVDPNAMETYAWKSWEQKLLAEPFIQENPALLGH